ncbi:MAG: hypothetical protein H6518_05960 [Microthrixaceae bacterium]|nr:hypothetical protein [Microthrixaceae bacterium]
MTLIIDAPVPASVPAMATVDLYLDIHKGIRADLFSVTGRAGSLDPADAAGRAGWPRPSGGRSTCWPATPSTRTRSSSRSSRSSAPDLAEVVATDHHGLEPRMDGLVALADAAADVAGAEARSWLHALYLDLALFTGDYLRHQETEGARRHAGAGGGHRPGRGAGPRGGPSSRASTGRDGGVAGGDAAGHEPGRPGRAARRHAGLAPRPRSFAGVWGAGRLCPRTPADHERLGERLGLA